jgi:nuclear transport factor 2 (NTF2) superfamily protein
MARCAIDDRARRAGVASRDPHQVCLAYTEDSAWRNRGRFVTGRDEIVRFLARKWGRELDYALGKELWAFDGNRIAVRFQHESRDQAGQWWRSYGNELWEFDVKIGGKFEEQRDITSQLDAEFPSLTS